MRACANLTWLFTEVPMLERFGIARSAGFDAVEILFPYDIAVQDLKDRLEINGLSLAMMNCPPPNYTDRPKGFAAVPGGAALFQTDFKRALRVARALNADHLHVMAGLAEGEAAKEAFLHNLRWAAEFAPDQSLLIEPVCAEDMPGYFLNSLDAALDVLDAVNMPNLRLLFDVHHIHAMTGDVLAAWDRCKGQVGHVQIADVPKRSEPGAGSLDFAAVFAALRDAGYQGWVAGEYAPGKDTPVSLGWLSHLA